MYEDFHRNSFDLGRELKALFRRCRYNFKNLITTIFGRNCYKHNRVRGWGYRALYTSCSIGLFKGPVQRAAQMHISLYSRLFARHLCYCVFAVEKASNFYFDYCEWVCGSSIIQLMHRSAVLSLGYELGGAQRGRILYRGQESHMGLCFGRVCRGCEGCMVGHRGRKFEGGGEGMGAEAS